MNADATVVATLAPISSYASRTIIDPKVDGTGTFAGSIAEYKPKGKDPSMLFHVGNPMQEEPHKSMERCTRFHEEHPTIRLIYVLWDEKDKAELEPLINKEKSEILMMGGEGGNVTAWLLDRLGTCVGAQIVSPRWYICPEGHITKGTYKELVEKCETCQIGIAIVEPFKAQVQQFADIFIKVINLANFDTTSGQFLHANVNPTKNVLLNMPFALGTPRNPSIECRHLRGTGKGKAAVICGAGPSLEDSLPHLKRIQDKVIIICVGRAYKLLKENGIRVDYTISCEMFDWDSAIFDGVTDTGDTVLAYASVCAPATVRKWPGKSVCLWDVETAKLLERDDYILGGNSVAHHMLNFAAQILECEPIVMVGIDLAYTKPRTHAKGTFHEWPEEIKKKEEEYQNESWVLCTGKGHDFDPECHRMPTAFMGGGVAISGIVHVRSSPAYENFATLFSILIAKHKKKIFNACPNGQKIEGTEYLNLETWAPCEDPASRN